MRILALDLGDVRTGMACCDELEMLASPVGVITEKDTDRLLEAVLRAIGEQRAKQVVVGYPKNMNNTIGERADICEAFAERLKERTDVPVALWDERGTTVAAHGYLNATNTRGKKRKQVVDAVAATIILDSYLQHRKISGKKPEDF